MASLVTLCGSLSRSTAFSWPTAFRRPSDGRAESTIMLMSVLLKLLTPRLELSRGALSTRAADSAHDEADVLEFGVLSIIFVGIAKKHDCIHEVLVVISTRQDHSGNAVPDLWLC